mgnify:CR=1 FL=1
MLAYGVLNQSQTKSISQEQIAGTELTADQIDKIINERLGKSVRQLGWILLLGTATTAALVGVTAYYLANRAIGPLLEIDRVVQKIGQGELNTKIAIAGQDELAQLGANINQMVNKITQLLQAQTQTAQRQMQDQTALVERERQQNQSIQQELLQFLMSIEEAASGKIGRASCRV